ncbi:MAG: radical SAM protein [Candidatus Thorarchaeota archaeon]
MDYKFVKGLNESTLGYKNILKVDISPKKVCNFDCVYCSVGRTSRWLMEREEFFSAEEIFNEIIDFYSHNDSVEGVLLTGSGEPALYKSFGKLARKIKEFYPNMIIMVYTNASLLRNKDVQEDFAVCNVVGCNLNSVFPEELQSISRPHMDVNIEDALQGLIEFGKHFKGQLLIDTKFIKGLNDTERNVQGLKEYLIRVQPNSYTIIGRKYKGDYLSDQFIDYLKNEMHDMPFPVSIFL